MYSYRCLQPPYIWVYLDKRLPADTMFVSVGEKLWNIVEGSYENSVFIKVLSIPMPGKAKKMN